MKVMFISPVPFFKGGAERSLFDLLRNPLIEPILVVPSAGPISEAANKMGIRVEYAEFKGIEQVHRPIRISAIIKAIRSTFRAARLIAEIAAHERVDIIHTNGLKAHVIGLLARCFGAPPVVCHVRDIAVYHFESLIWKTIGYLSSASILVSRPCWPGRHMPDHIKVIPNAINVDKLPILSHATNKNICIGFCGRLHPFKGVHVLLEWFAVCLENNQSCHLVIRGEDVETGLGYRTCLDAKINKLGISEKVIFEGKRDGFQEIYGGIDVVVVPSVVPDPLPRSVMEAMAAGLPVVAYPAGGIPDMVDDGENGWLVKTADTFCHVIEVLSSDPELSIRIGSEARKKIANKFSFDSMYKEINCIYDGLSSGSKL